MTDLIQNGSLTVFETSVPAGFVSMHRCLSVSGFNDDPKTKHKGAVLSTTQPEQKRRQVYCIPENQNTASIQQMHMAMILECSWYLTIKKKKKHMHLLLDSTRATSRMWLSFCLWPPLVGLASTTKVFTQAFFYEAASVMLEGCERKCGLWFLPTREQGNLIIRSLAKSGPDSFLRWLFAIWVCCSKMSTCHVLCGKMYHMIQWGLH